MPKEHFLQRWNQRPDQYRQVADFSDRMAAVRREHEAVIPQDELGRAMYEYRQAWEANTLTPDLVNRTWQTVWKVKAENANLGRELQVPLCDRTPEELAALREENRGVILLPGEILQDRSLLANLFPSTGRTLLRGKFSNVSDQEGGCIDVEMDSEASYKGQTLARWNLRLSHHERTGQRLETYVVASEFHKLLTDHYFDEQSRSILLGSRGSASFLSGSAHIFSDRWTISQSQYHGNRGGDSRSGMRSEGRKR